VGSEGGLILISFKLEKSGKKREKGKHKGGSLEGGGREKLEYEGGIFSGATLNY